MFKHASYDRTEIENVDGARHLNASEQASTQHGPAAVPTRIVEGNGTQRAIRMSTAVGRTTSVVFESLAAAVIREVQRLRAAGKNRQAPCAERRADRSGAAARQAYEQGAETAAILARRRREKVAVVPS